MIQNCLRFSFFRSVIGLELTLHPGKKLDLISVFSSSPVFAPSVQGKRWLISLTGSHIIEPKIRTHAEPLTAEHSHKMRRILYSRVTSIIWPNYCFKWFNVQYQYNWWGLCTAGYFQNNLLKKANAGLNFADDSNKFDEPLRV